MTNTTNYNLLLAEGTDLVNYLTQTNPNFTSLDTIIKGVSDLTVTPATEVTTGTAHAISKTLADATVIKFTATSNWQTGDTMTLDGNPVTPLKTDGTTLKTGDYIIGSAVLMIQDGTRLTVLVASSPDAGDINYDNTVSGLTANKVQGAIDENAAAINTINSNLYRVVATSTANTTYASQLAELKTAFNLLSSAYKNKTAIISSTGQVFTLSSNVGMYSITGFTAGTKYIDQIYLPSTIIEHYEIPTNTITDNSNVTFTGTLSLVIK